MPEIVSVEPVEKTFSITWMVGIRCNYDCMYCPPSLHDNVSPSTSLETMQSYWKSIVEKTQHLNLKYKISFTGGEITVNKNFLPLVEWLKSNYQEHLSAIICTTNGSASANYYKKLYNYVDNISFSFHSEFADSKQFFEKMIELKRIIPGSKFIHVNIMDEFWIQDKIPEYVELLSQQGISHSVNQINYKYQTRNIPIVNVR